MVAKRIANTSPERLRELLHYDPDTGLLHWLVQRQCIRAGARGGSRNRDGYMRICIEGRMYGLHRVAWAWMTGAWPEHLVDHRDMDRSNNRWSNLRAATDSQNKANGRIYKNNTSGMKGVTKQKNRWLAFIGGKRPDGKGRLCLGSFKTPEEAQAAYLRAAQERYGEFARAA